MALHISSPSEQVARHLRGEILRGRWKEEVPGVAQLQKELGVNHVTINAALQLLENQGLLASQGQRRPRRIIADEILAQAQKISICILPYDSAREDASHYIGILHELHRAGFDARISSKTISELGGSLSRVTRYIQRSGFEAWVVSSRSQELLHWLADEKIPAMALFGRFHGVPIAAVGLDKGPLMAELLHRLVKLGHQRIVMLSHRERLFPEPAPFEQGFLSTLQSLGIETGPYNLPDWQPSPAGLQKCLDELFRFTPPTVIIADEARFLIAVRQYLTRKGLDAPSHVSLICNDTDPSFAWSSPPVSHMGWSPKKVSQRVVRWANNLTIGKEDLKQQVLPAEWVEGGTIGPVPS